MTTLTTRDKNICSYGGLFGILISLTCLIQHLAITTSHWLATVMIFMYIFSIVCFSLLAAHKWSASILLVINTAVVLVAEVILMRHGVFSLAVIFLFIYTAIITVFTFVEQIPAKLKQRLMMIRAEEQHWQDKI